MLFRFGFNGMESDEEINAIDFGARIYDGRLGRWLSVDPLKEKYPSILPYVYVANNPVLFVDPDGKQITMYMTKNIFGKPVINIQIDGKIMDKTGQNLSKNDLALRMSYYSSVAEGVLSRKFPGFNVKVTMNFTVAESSDQVSPNDHVIYLVETLTEKGDKGLKPASAAIGGKIMYVADDVYGHPAAEHNPYGVHEIGHWLGLLHPWDNGYESHFPENNLMRYGDGIQMETHQVYQMMSNYDRGMLNRGDNKFTGIKPKDGEEIISKFKYDPSKMRIPIFDFSNSGCLIEPPNSDVIIKSPRFL